MQIRAATPGDAAAIAAIHRAARKKAMPWLPDMHSAAEDEDYFGHHVIGQQTVLISSDKATPTGFIAFGHGRIDHLYVHPDHWRRGIGTALLGQAQMAAKRLELWVFQRNDAARRFYNKHGFLEVARTDGAGNDEKTPDIRMVWKFWG